MTYYFRGQLAKAACINIETLRFYEKNGLIPILERTKGVCFTEPLISRLHINHDHLSGFEVQSYAP